MMFRTVCWPACGWFQKYMCLSNGSALRIGTSTLETTSNLHFQGDPLLKRKSDIPAPWHPSRPWCLGHPAKPPSQEKHWNKSKWSLRYGQSLNPFISPKRISRICYFHLSRFPTQKKDVKNTQAYYSHQAPLQTCFSLYEYAAWYGNATTGPTRPVGTWRCASSVTSCSSTGSQWGMEVSTFSWSQVIIRCCLSQRTCATSSWITYDPKGDILVVPIW